MMKPPWTHKSNMTEEERRHMECFFARLAIRSVLMQWGPRGWENLSPEMREAYLALDIMKYMGGGAWAPLFGMDQQTAAAYGWSAEDCLRVLGVCRDWSYEKEYGPDLARLAAYYREGPRPSEEDDLDVVMASARRP